jgi:LacI family transcriptional regulator
MLARHNIASLFLLPSAMPQGTLNWLADTGLPTVILDRPIDDRRFDQVIVDMRAEMYRAGLRLISLGHRRLLFVTGKQHLLVSQRRIEGLRQAIRESGHPVTVRILERGADREEAVSGRIAEIMREEQAPTAIIGTNAVAIGWIIATLRRQTLQIREQISLLAADEPEWVRLMQPATSFVHAPASVVAAQACALLRARMEGFGGRPRRISIDPELHVADSIGPAPALQLRV